MTDAEMARALSGATRECPYDYHGNADPEIANSCRCGGTGRVPILNPERARKACQGCRQCVVDVADRINRPWWDKDICGGSGWLSTLLLPEEPCPAVHSIEGNQCGEHLCDGSGVRRRPDTDLLISLLEEEGWRVGRGLGAGWFTCDPVSGWIIHPSDPSILVAACEALKVEVKP